MSNHVTIRYLAWHNSLSSAYNDLFMKHQISQDRIDVMHFPANYGFGPHDVATVITLHDAINILPLREIIRGHAKNYRTLLMMTYLHYVTQVAIRKADLLLTVSPYARNEIARNSGYDPGKIVPVPHAPTPDLRRITDQQILDDVRKRFGLDGPFVLADALKNPAVLIKAWRLLPNEIRESRQLAFFARRPDPLPIVQEAVASNEARLFVRPLRADLIALYSMAEAFVFPSWIEGFGIPILEAMVCGAPVIASNRGAIPEVAGNAALYTDAEDAETLAKHLIRVLSSPAEAERLRCQGFKRAARFSWDSTAKQILAGYKLALETKRRSRLI